MDTHTTSSSAVMIIKIIVVQRGGTCHPFQNWSENNTDHCVSSIDSIGKQLPLLCAPSSLGCDLIYAKATCSSTVRDMMDRGMNFAMYILGITCHNAQCVLQVCSKLTVTKLIVGTVRCYIDDIFKPQRHRPVFIDGSYIQDRLKYSLEMS
ncbi:hypothetical protein ALC56_09176 [Trachymyrmex septentrionalis]|uniref:Uncharacterized protein n=1 Tax=Trachymyrmex septentrionalis TaxID=34720 RepID=A0A195F754_9HYME|nr:hypothetical protein ALC56_09176 [Trachymyrmex septentrionalis]